jgi:hypothetical protein
MACNCQGSKTGQQQSFVYTAPDGSKKTYTSEVQARAAQIRNGGSYKAVAA